MSLKITNANGFKIGGILNPSIQEIYVRVLVDMTKQRKVVDVSTSTITHLEIKSEARITLDGGFFDENIQVDFIFKNYWLKYRANVSDMNERKILIENDLKTKLIVDNPEWDGKITIVTLGLG